MRVVLRTFVLLLLVPALVSVPVGAALAVGPSWNIQFIIYKNVDFTYTDADGGSHRVVTSMAPDEWNAAVAAANTFVKSDIPLLTSGNQRPRLSIKLIDAPLISLDPDTAGGFAPSPAITASDRDPGFDSTIVMWKSDGWDFVGSSNVNLAHVGGLTYPVGALTTYSEFSLTSFTPTNRNVFKHEWGHAILWYFQAVKASPLPTVDNHLPASYVNCRTGRPYVLTDDDDTNPVPNSIFNNGSGFTRDYYSGTTATVAKPGTCIGITPLAWGIGGPVTRAPNLLKNPGFEVDADANGRPDSWTSDARFTRSSSQHFLGSYSGRHRATDNSSHSISQTASGLTGGAGYYFAGRVSIPATTDSFTYRLQVEWRHANNSVLRTDTLRTYTGATTGFSLTQATRVAPAGTTNARVVLAAIGLNATVYVDALTFRRG